MRVRRIGVFQDWPGLLLAFLAALATWFALKERAPSVERILSLPLTPVGLGEGWVAQGLPREVLVRIRGPAPLVQGPGLPLTAYLDLSRVEGRFSREVQVAAPRGVEVLEVRPARVEGQVEALLERDLPVEVLLPDGVARVEPVQVRAKGPRSQVEVAVGAFGLALGPEAPLVAWGPEGPLPGLALTPDRVRVVGKDPFLAFKEVELRLLPPPGLALAAYAPRRLTLVGPRSALAGLDRVELTLPSGLRPGETELTLSLNLPEGVRPLGEVRVRLRLALE